MVHFFKQCVLILPFCTTANVIPSQMFNFVIYGRNSKIISAAILPLNNMYFLDLFKYYSSPVKSQFIYLSQWPSFLEEEYQSSTWRTEARWSPIKVAESHGFFHSYPISDRQIHRKGEKDHLLTVTAGNQARKINRTWILEDLTC